MSAAEGYKAYLDLRMEAHAMLDLVVRGGTVVDGTGAKAFSADVGVADGRIVEIGKVGAGRQEIDADGALVTPGFIDPHTHYDGQVTWDDQIEGSIANGVTTVVMGNCGVGFAPVVNGKVPDLIDLMEGVEDIPGTALYEGIPWGEWETFPEYLDFLNSRKWTLDVGTQLPHGALRFYVMGERAIRDEHARDEDLAQMREIVTQSVRAGALGFSTSRIQAHKSMSGYPVPGTFAPEAELQAIGAGIRDGGGAVFQAIPSNVNGSTAGVAPDHSSLLDEVALLGRISRTNQLNVIFSLWQNYSEPDMWRQALAAVARENGDGSRLSPMVGPRALMALTTLRGFHMFKHRPTFHKLADLPWEQLVAELRRPEIKRAILAEEDALVAGPGALENILVKLFQLQPDGTFPLAAPVQYEPTAEESFAARAAAAGVTPDAFIYDYLLGDQGTAVGMYLGVNYINGDLEACREMLLDPNTISGLSDAGAHVQSTCDMSLPTLHLTHWVRDRTRGPRIPLERMVAEGSARPAQVYGLHDRGSVEIGKRADLNIIDFDRLTILPPEFRADLPTGSQRWVQRAQGYVATVVHGEVVREADEDTGVRPGRLVRRPA